MQRFLRPGRGDDETKVVNNPVLRSFHGIRESGKGSLDDNDPTSAADAYRKSALIRRCARVRATTLADIPLKVLDANDEELPDNHPIARLFTPGNSRLFYNIELDMAIHGKAFIEMSPYRPKLTRLNPYTMHVETDPHEGVTSFRQEIDGEVIARWSPQHMGYIHDYDPLDDLDSSSPVQAAIVAAGLELNANDFARAYFANDATPAGMLSSDQELDQGQIKRIGNMWRRMFGGVANRFKFGIGGSGLKFLPITPPLKDLAMAELKAEVRRDICTAMEVPLTIALATDAANYATSREQRLSFYTETVLPELDLILDTFNADILPYYQKGIRVEIDRQKIEVLQEDAIELTTRAVEGFGTGIYTLNEARTLEGLEPFPDVVDVIVINGTAIPVATLKKGMSAEEMMNALQPPMLPEGEEDEGGQKPDGGGGGDKPKQPKQGGDGDRQGKKPQEPKGAAQAGKRIATVYKTDEFGALKPEWTVDEALSDLARWRRKVRAKGVQTPFKSEHIPPAISALLRLDLQRLHAHDAFKLAQDDLEGRGPDQQKPIKLDAGDPLASPTTPEVTGDDILKAVVDWERRNRGPYETLLSVGTKSIKPTGPAAIKDDTEPPYVWNPKAMRYQEATGKRRFVSRQKFIDLLEDQIEAHAADMAQLTERVFKRAITVAVWEEAMRQSIKLVHVKLALLGRGGRQVMTLAERGALGGRLKAQYRWLARYADVLRSESFAEKALAGLMRRSELYARSARASFYDMQIKAAIVAGMDRKRRYLTPGAEHCDDCLAEEALGWVDINSTKVTLPGAGHTQCLTNCKCTLVFAYDVKRQEFKTFQKGYPEFRQNQARGSDGRWIDEGKGDQPGLVGDARGGGTDTDVEDRPAGGGAIPGPDDVDEVEFEQVTVGPGGDPSKDPTEFEFTELEQREAREAHGELQALPVYRTPGGEEVPSRPIPEAQPEEAPAPEGSGEQAIEASAVFRLKPVDPSTGEVIDMHHSDHAQSDYVVDPRNGEITLRSELTATANAATALAAQGSVPGWDASQLQGNRPVRKVPVEPMEGPATPFAALEPEQYIESRDKVDPRYKGMLTPYTAEDLQAKLDEGYQLFGTDSNGNGSQDVVYLMSPQFDLQGLVNTGEVKGAATEAMIDGIARGAETLDAFDGFLPGHYAKFGFVEYERYEFDPQYAPPEWNMELHDSPDVVLMRYPEGLSRDPEEVRQRFEAAQRLERLQTGDQ